MSTLDLVNCDLVRNPRQIGPGLLPTMRRARAQSPARRVRETTVARLPPGYSASKDQLLKRLKRVEGQVRGVQTMVDEDRYCIDVLTQISAIQAALDKVALGLIDDHARHCVIDGPDDLKEDRTEELMAAVARLARGR